MSDVYIPGVKSRFNTEKLIEDLMKVERVPRDRIESGVKTLETEKTYWQDVGRRMTSLRDSARLLYSFQNPFNDRTVVSQDDSVISATVTREAVEQEHRFTVEQVAASDRFISNPLDSNYKVAGGTYTFTIGTDEVSFNFREGSLKEFADALNRRGREKIQARVINVEPGTRSLLIESLVTGEKNKLGFAADAEKLVLETGIAERINDTRLEVSLTDTNVRGVDSRNDPRFITVKEGSLTVAAGGKAQVIPDMAIRSVPALVLSMETATVVKPDDALTIPRPPPGPSIPETGSVTYGDITIENDLSAVPLPPWTPPELPPRVDNLAVLSLTFSDGTMVKLPAITDSEDFTARQYRLGDVAPNKVIVGIDLLNNNTHRDVSLRNIQVFDPGAGTGFSPRNPVSVASDSVIVMDGIEIKRSGNSIDDLIPGVTVIPRSVSGRPVTLEITPDREGIKEAIINLVGNYNRLMAEVNVLTRNDDRVIQELSYLSVEEQEDYRKRLGIFSADTTLSQFRTTLQRAAATPYPTDGQPMLLSQLGIGTDVRRSGASSGYDASRLRGYLEIDEKALDAALESRLDTIRQLFGFDTDGDLIVDSGLAYTLETLARPYMETGGIISLKTGAIDSRITQDQRRIDTLDRQLAARETALKQQYGQMEGAFNRMERMSTSLDQFSQRATNTNNNR
jgi:flagellar hook-associated protein 2